MRLQVIILLMLPPLLLSGCAQTRKTSVTVTSQNLNITCDENNWNCPDKKDASIKITPKTGGETNLIMEKFTSPKTIDEFFIEKKDEVYKYPGNELIEEGDLDEGKFFINKNTYSNNYLFRAIKKVTDGEYVVCSGYSPERSFETVKTDFQSMCSGISAQ